MLVSFTTEWLLACKWAHELLNIDCMSFFQCNTLVSFVPIIPFQRIEMSSSITSLSEITFFCVSHRTFQHTHTIKYYYSTSTFFAPNKLVNTLHRHRYNFASISIFITPFLRLLIECWFEWVELKRADKQITYWIPKKLFDFYLHLRTGPCEMMVRWWQFFFIYCIIVKKRWYLWVKTLNFL